MMQLDMFPVEANLRKIDPESNMQRFYHLRIERTLFGEWCLIRQWGRIGSYGRLKREWFDNVAEAIGSLERLTGAKVRRGYIK